VNALSPPQRLPMGVFLGYFFNIRSARGVMGRGFLAVGLGREKNGSARGITPRALRILKKYPKKTPIGNLCGGER